MPYNRFQLFCHNYVRHPRTFMWIMALGLYLILYDFDSNSGWENFRAGLLCGAVTEILTILTISMMKGKS